MFKCLLIITFSGLSYLSAISNILLENGREILKKTVPIFANVTKPRLYTTKIEDSMRVIPISPSEINSFAKMGLKQFERQFKTCPQVWTPCEDIKDKYHAMVGERAKRPNVALYGSVKYQRPLGFFMGQYITPPGVYAPGLTMLVQEIHIEGNEDYLSIGTPLIKRVREGAREKSATQWVFINDSTQVPFFDHLMQLEKLSICSQWWAGIISNSNAIDFPNIYPITHEDLEEVVELSSQKRMAYSLVQPLFWKPASNANEVQYEYFTGLIKEKSTLGYIFKRGKSIEGFIIGEIYPANPFYKKVQLCKVDDYTVKNEQWETVGKQLLMALQQDALTKGADYLYVVSGYHHLAKMKLLSELGFKKVSDTWTGAI